jgi:MSHA biogenesis protein MshO
MRASRGMTLIELVVAMVLVSIVVAATVYFVFPVRQAADVSVRAQLSDAADNALQRMGRDVRLSLPNSVRTACAGQCVEYIPVRTAGRYRGEASGAGCDTGADAGGSDELAFDVADGCFKSIGSLPNANTIVANSDFLVLNNYGTGFAGQDAYETATPPFNRTLISQADEQGGRERINFVPPSNVPAVFSRSLHDSAGRRFYIVTTPVTFECDTVGGTLKRWSGYAYGAAYTTGTGLLLANNVTSCNFDYTTLGTQIGLLTLRLTLSKTVSSGQAETVSLYHSVHVSNVP